MILYMRFERNSVFPQNRSAFGQVNFDSIILPYRFESLISVKGSIIGKLAYQKRKKLLLYQIYTVANTFYYGINVDMKFQKGFDVGNINLIPMGNFGVRNENGMIYYSREKNRKLTDQAIFDRYKFSDREYDAYEVCFYGKGTYYCVYSENCLVAVISKYGNIHKTKAVYDIFAEDGFDRDILLLFTTYWDMKYCINIPINEENDWYYRHVTISSDYLKSKFDPSFVKSISEQENLDITFDFPAEIQKS